MVTLMVVEGQEKSLGQIVKAFVTLGFCNNIDSMFVGNMPLSAKKNLAALNKKGGLTMPKNKNTYSNIFLRLKQALKERNSSNIWREIFNIIVNIEYTILVNFQIVVFNYFAAIMVIIVQMIGYFYIK